MKNIYWNLHKTHKKKIKDKENIKKSKFKKENKSSQKS